jgi:hypothetical protein
LQATASPLTSLPAVASGDRSHWLETVEKSLLLGVMFVCDL